MSHEGNHRVPDEVERAYRFVRDDAGRIDVEASLVRLAEERAAASDEATPPDPRWWLVSPVAGMLLSRRQPVRPSVRRRVLADQARLDREIVERAAALEG